MDSSSKRKSSDITKLMMSDYAVELVNDGDSEFIVEFQGPKGSLYEGGVWKVQVQLPDDYPYKPPVVEFKNKIFHPNIDDLSGNVCVDVLDENWSPIYDLVKVFEDFLPQLLRDPNPSDPLNLDAAAFMLEDEKLYEEKVKEYCELYAKEINAPQVENESSDDKTSDGQCTSSDEDFPGDADP